MGSAGEENSTLRPADSSAAKNYMTSRGYARLRAELRMLLDSERPDLVKVIAWAASNGDRSENGDYLYGKKRLREIDRRIHFLTKRLDSATIVDPSIHGDTDRIFFGATVTYVDGDAGVETVTIVGVDEVDPRCRHVSWVSPVARALLTRCVGDMVKVRTPVGEREIEIVEVRYDPVEE